MRYILGNKLLALPRRPKQLILLAADVVILEFSLWAAFALRLETWHIPVKPLGSLALLVPLFAFPIFVRLGLYRAIVRYVGLHALVTIAKAVGLYALVLAAAIHFLGIADAVPRSVVPIHGLLSLLLIGASRAVARHWLSTSMGRQQNEGQCKRVLIYGAGSAGIQLASALSHSRELLPVGMLDDDVCLHDKQIGTLKVYSPADLRQLVDRLSVAEILLAIPSVSRQRRNEIIAGLETLPVVVRTLPGVAELAQGRVAISDLREIDIEDLLGRDPVEPDPRLMEANVTGKSIMVTGAGGSIGSELCRQILTQRPSLVVLYEINEFALYRIEQELFNLQRDLASNCTIVPLLGSVCDKARIERAMCHFGVKTVFHAAAYKHVPMVERNPCEGALNNVLGTLQAARAALASGVEAFVLISTDKAVRPTNVMGATKRLAEMVLQAMAAEYPGKTRFTMVRFGNVLGSSGSVIPLFREQIKRGGPLTVTDPRIVRYFMTIPEAAQLVIQAGAMGNDGDVFVLDMGEPVRILDLAQRMIHLSGLATKDDDNPDGDIDIVFTGLRPGEKLYEELLIGDNVTPTDHSRIRKANEHCLGWTELVGVLRNLEAACANSDSAQLRSILRSAVREFVPQCDNQDLLCSLGAAGAVPECEPYERSIRCS